MNHGGENQSTAEGPSQAGSSDQQGVEGSRSSGFEGSYDRAGPEGSGNPSSPRQGEYTQSPENDEHNHGYRHYPRVPTQETVEALESAIQEAFTTGDPQQVWVQVRELVHLSKNLVRESAEVRFKNNFGTEVCERCDGLKAGPGVAATCYQIRQCYYTNKKVDATTPKQAQLIERLAKNKA